MSDFAIVPYDEALHRGWVASTFVESMSATWPWSRIPHRALEARFWPEVRRPGNAALVAIAPGDPTTVMGWTVCRPAKNEIVAGFTRYRHRRLWKIGRSLCDAAGIDFARPVGVWFWTYATERLFREHAGYGRLYHKVTDDEDHATPPVEPAAVR